MLKYVYNAGEADGKILTSTEWEQSGLIYLDGHYISGYTYNRYCPYLSSSQLVHSVTGCTNTADAQILFYHLSMGVQLKLSVSSSDYFTLKSRRNHRYYLSETASVGEGTISVLNAILAGIDNYVSGDFIAALNFYCGVKNHSTYGDSTSTSVSSGTFWDGDVNLKVFKAAGFDSYFSIGETNTLFFISQSRKSQLTDTAYSIIRENLDYGEPVRVDIPEHSIYLDGYRLNSQTNEYEYHLNYGWGPDSYSNRWYTVAEIRDISFDTLGIDLDPKIRVTVMNSKSEYYGGSFLRGVERINHIQNDTKTTFSFVDEIAGDLIYLDTVDFTSNVDLDFLNWNIGLCTRDARALTSRRTLSFENQTGGIIVNSRTASACITVNGQSAVDIDLNGGYYFSGYTDREFSVIEQWLSEYWDNENELLGSSQGSRAVISGDGDDVIRLAGQSVIAGGISLGGGNNSVIIESGSAVYGGISAENGSLNMAFLAGKSAERTMLHLTADPESFFNATGGELYFYGSNDLSHSTYYLVEFQDDEWIHSFSVNITLGDKSFVLDSDNSAADCAALIYSDHILALSIGDPVPIITVQASETEWTRNPITVTASFTLAGEPVPGEFSLDRGASWLAWTGPVSIEENTDLWFRCIDSEEDVVVYSVSNIDREAPAITNIEVAYSPSKTAALVSADFADGQCLKDTMFRTSDAEEWQTYTGPIKVLKNCTVFLMATDSAGNSFETSVIISEIEKNTSAKFDIDSNGLSDILMQQKKNTGKKQLDCGAWLTQLQDSPSWGNLSQLSAFQYLFGTGFFTPGKNTQDIFIYDTIANSVSVWLTDDSGNIAGWEPVEFFSSSTMILGLGNFNDGETSDLLLQNTNGAVGYFLTDGDDPGWHYIQSLGSEWKICTIGDFNNDLRSDLVLRNDQGYAGCWLTNADGNVSWQNLDTLSDDFEIIGAGDFDGDGTDDILLKNGTYYGAWIVQNGSVSEWMGFGVLGDVTVEQIGDFDGDGIDDLRIRTGAGDLGALLVRGEDNLEWRYFGSVGSEWKTSLIAI